MPKKRKKQPGAAHLQAKIKTYENYLYQYLPLLSGLSFITRINLYDCFAAFGLTQDGNQGTPFVVYQAIHKQRNHLLQQKQTLRPFSFTVVDMATEAESRLSYAMPKLKELNEQDSTCKFDFWSVPFLNSLSKLKQKIKNQPNTEKNIYLLDAVNMSEFSVQSLFQLVEQKVELFLFLPITQLYRLHLKPDTPVETPSIHSLKREIDQLFAPEHAYWLTEDLTEEAFARFVVQEFTQNEKYFVCSYQAAHQKECYALLGVTKDAFMAEKMLVAKDKLEQVKVSTGKLPGDQLSLFGGGVAPVSAPENPKVEQVLKEVLQQEESMDNQQLYKKVLLHQVLPQQAQEVLQQMREKKQVKVLNEKQKTLPAKENFQLSYTLYKVAKPAYFFVYQGK